MLFGPFSFLFFSEYVSHGYWSVRSVVIEEDLSWSIRGSLLYMLWRPCTTISLQYEMMSGRHLAMTACNQRSVLQIRSLEAIAT